MRAVLPLQQGKQNALRDIYHNYFHVLLYRERHNLILCHAEVLYEATWPVDNYVCVCVCACVCVCVCLIKLTVVQLRAEYLLV